MPLKAVVFQQDPFNYGSKETNSYDSFGLQQQDLQHDHDQKPNVDNLNGEQGNYLANGCCSGAQNTGATSSTDTCAAGDGFLSGGGCWPAVAPVTAASRRKKRRTKSTKNVEEMENQRMTHIAVERNRRRQMNDYLAVLRSLMPPSYAQRGDQASIVGGAINYVKELEQLLQFLEAHKPANQLLPPNAAVLSNFFTFPQYSTSQSNAAGGGDRAAERRSGIADIEVTMAESHANIKILSEKCQKRLLRMVCGFQAIGLTILHLNITTVDQSVLYSFSVKVEEECQLSTVNEIATAVHEILGIIQKESTSTTP